MLPALKRVARTRLGEELMALVHHHEPDRAHDLALVGLVVVVFAIIAAAVPCLKLAVDQFFSLIW
jgi:hypothetical protein